VSIGLKQNRSYQLVMWNQMFSSLAPQIPPLTVKVRGAEHHPFQPRELSTCTRECNETNIPQTTVTTSPAASVLPSRVQSSHGTTPPHQVTLHSADRHYSDRPDPIMSSWTSITFCRIGYGERVCVCCGSLLGSAGPFLAGQSKHHSNSGRVGLKMGPEGKFGEINWVRTFRMRVESRGIGKRSGGNY